MKGTVKFFDEMKGFGFIVSEDGKEVFVHQSGLQEGETLHENDAVTFDVEDGDRGPKAVNVKKETGEEPEKKKKRGIKERIAKLEEEIKQKKVDLSEGYDLAKKLHQKMNAAKATYRKINFKIDPKKSKEAYVQANSSYNEWYRQFKANGLLKKAIEDKIPAEIERLKSYLSTKK